MYNEDQDAGVGEHEDAAPAPEVADDSVAEGELADSSAADSNAAADEIREDDVAPSGPPSEGALAEASRAIEAIVMSSTDPAPSQLLAQMVELPLDAVVLICQNLAQSYEDEGRGFQLAEVAGGWRYQTHPSTAPYVARFALEGQTARLSGAALETLAIVAYKQPISRAQVSAIRGVNVDGVLRTLEQRGYIGEVARDAGPGQAIMFGTTPLFLERVGLASRKDLPPLGEFVPSAEVVEALEQSLRVENEAGYAADVAAAEGANDVSEIDLTDEVSNDLIEPEVDDLPEPEVEPADGGQTAMDTEDERYDLVEPSIDLVEPIVDLVEPDIDLTASPVEESTPEHPGS